MQKTLTRALVLTTAATGAVAVAAAPNAMATGHTTSHRVAKQTALTTRFRAPSVGVVRASNDCWVAPGGGQSCCGYCGG